MESIDKRRKATRTLRRWLETFDWTWYVKLNIKTGAMTDTQIEDLFLDWISEVERVHGDAGFYWVRVLERRPTRQQHRFHVLIGGLRDRRKDLAKRWTFLGGDAVIDRHNLEHDGILSMVKTIDDDGSIDIDFKVPWTGVVAPIQRTVRSRDEDGTSDSESTARLRVSNIGEVTSPNNLRDLYSRYGKVFGIWIHSSDRNNFALVDISRSDIAEAVESTNGLRWRGSEIRVEEAEWGTTPSDFGRFEFEDEIKDKSSD